jgi:hypothetical protein
MDTGDMIRLKRKKIGCKRKKKGKKKDMSSDLFCDLNTTKYNILFNRIQKLNMRDVRITYSGLRQSFSKTSTNEDVDVFFPRLGFTAGEFAVAQILKVPRKSYN